MTILKKVTALALVLALLLSLGLTVHAAEKSTDELVRQLINYYHHYQGDARLDYELILAEIEKQDASLAKTWEGILEFWIELNDDMEFPTGVLPDGLPEDDSLCIAVMGYYLESDGGIRDELYARLRVALASAEKYPNAYILCTGGGTASGNSKVTEASQMARWLKSKGIDPDRIIVEDQALSTIQNATYGCELLYRDYPQVKSIAVVTSDYHIYRSCFYFNTRAALDAYEAGTEPMKVVASASCRIDPGASRDVSRQVEGAGMLTGLDGVEDLPKPALSELDHISVSGQSEYASGGELNLTVTAHYSTGYTRDVTAKAVYSGFDFSASGFQTVTVSYTEGDVQKTAAFDVYVLPPETLPPEPPTEVSTEPPAVTEPVSRALPQQEDPGLSVPLIFGGICILALILLTVLKIRRSKKRRRRPRPTIKLD